MREASLHTFTSVAAAPTLDEAAARLGAIIGLVGPAPLEVTRRALEDPIFARALMGARKLPELRDRLLAGQMRVGGTGTSDRNAKSSTTGYDPPSTIEAVTQIAGAVLKWGMEGLRLAEPWVVERRLAACNSCEFQAPAPDTLVYRGAKVAVGKDAKICTVCHCLTNTKAAISTEHCPERHPADPKQSRWGEPWLDPRLHPAGPWR